MHSDTLPGQVRAFLSISQNCLCFTQWVKGCELAWKDAAASDCRDDDLDLKQTRTWKLLGQSTHRLPCFLRFQIKPQISDVQKNVCAYQYKTLFIFWYINYLGGYTWREALDELTLTSKHKKKKTGWSEKKISNKTFTHMNVILFSTVFLSLTNNSAWFVAFVGCFNKTSTVSALY